MAVCSELFGTLFSVTNTLIATPFLKTSWIRFFKKGVLNYTSNNRNYRHDKFRIIEESQVN